MSKNPATNTGFWCQVLTSSGMGSVFHAPPAHLSALLTAEYLPYTASGAETPALEAGGAALWDDGMSDSCISFSECVCFTRAVFRCTVEF